MMSYGMTIDEFWNSNPRIAKIYVKAYENRFKLLDEQMWLMGRYAFVAVYIAIEKTFGNNEKHPFKDEYPDRPFSQLAKMTEEEREEERLEKEMRKMIQQEEAWIVNAKMRGLPKNVKKEEA